MQNRERKFSSTMKPDGDLSEYFERGAKAIDEGWDYNVILSELREVVRELITPPIARKDAIPLNIRCFDRVSHLGMEFYEYLNKRTNTTKQP